MKEIIVRHGDLILKPITSIPSGVKKQTNNVLALGEFTGHLHQFPNLGDVSVFLMGDKKYIDVKKTSNLTHQEHKTIAVPKGLYELGFEREYDYFQDEIKAVQD